MMEDIEKFGILWTVRDAKTNTLYTVKDDSLYNSCKIWFMLVQDKNNQTQYLAFHNTSTTKDQIVTHLRTSKYSQRQKLYEIDNISLNKNPNIPKYSKMDYDTIFDNKNLYAIPEQYINVIEKIDSKLSKYVAKYRSNSTKNVKYWIYSAGEKSYKWDEFYKDGIMAIGWDYLGDLTKYSSQAEIADKITKEENKTQYPMNDSKANWEFAKDMQVGDIVYVKKGLQDALIGRGIVKWVLMGHLKNYFSAEIRLYV